MKFTAEPFPFFDNGVSYFANYYAVKGGFASDEQISISGNSPELGDVGYPIHAEVAVWAENSYIGKCFLDCQFTGARSKHITDFKRTAAVGSAETWTLHVSYAEDSFTGYTAELSVDTAKSIVWGVGELLWQVNVSQIMIISSILAFASMWLFICQAVVYVVYTGYEALKQLHAKKLQRGDTT